MNTDLEDIIASARANNEQDQSLFVSPSTTHRSEDRHSNSSPLRPRLSSPRLLRNAFDQHQTGSTSTLPRPVNYQETLRDVEHALHNADMALRNAQAAFRQGRLAHANSNNVVDLTASSDDNNDDSFMTQTRHPHDTNHRISRPATSMNDPDLMAALNSNPANPTPGQRVFWQMQMQQFGQFGQLAGRHQDLPSFRSYLEPNIHVGPPPDPSPSYYVTRPQNAATADEQAIRRQRQARRDWARNQRLLQIRRAREAAQAGASAVQARNDNQFREGAMDENRSRSSSVTSLSSSDSDSASPSSSYPSETQTTENSTMPSNTIDLTGVDDTTVLSAVLAKEQQAAIAAQPHSQNSQTATKSAFGNYKCAICMDSPKDATTTICGHLFCHRCIIDSLRWSERQRREEQAPGRRVNGLCPVCRKSLQSKDVTMASNRASGGLVTLEIKQIPRKQYEKNKKQADFFDNLKQRKDKENGVAASEESTTAAQLDEAAEEVGTKIRTPRSKRKRQASATNAGRSQTNRESVDLDSLFDYTV